MTELLGSNKSKIARRVFEIFELFAEQRENVAMMDTFVVTDGRSRAHLSYFVVW